MSQTDKRNIYLKLQIDSTGEEKKINVSPTTTPVLFMSVIIALNCGLKFPNIQTVFCPQFKKESSCCFVLFFCQIHIIYPSVLTQIF